MTKRKQYSKEFKLDAVSLVTEQGYTQLEAAKRLEINANMLSRWVRELSDTDEQAFRGNGKLTPLIRKQTNDLELKLSAWRWSAIY